MLPTASPQPLIGARPRLGRASVTPAPINVPISPAAPPVLGIRSGNDTMAETTRETPASHQCVVPQDPADVMAETGHCLSLLTEGVGSHPQADGD
jgi:hypothetical protein